jgi:hypothetical protein
VVEVFVPEVALALFAMSEEVADTAEAAAVAEPEAAPAAEADAPATAVAAPAMPDAPVLPVVSPPTVSPPIVSPPAGRRPWRRRVRWPAPSRRRCRARAAARRAGGDGGAPGTAPAAAPAVPPPDYVAAVQAVLARGRRYPRGSAGRGGGGHGLAALHDPAGRRHQRSERRAILRRCGAGRGDGGDGGARRDAAAAGSLGGARR